MQHPFQVEDGKRDRKTSASLAESLVKNRIFIQSQGSHATAVFRKDCPVTTPCQCHCACPQVILPLMPTAPPHLVPTRTPLAGFQEAQKRGKQVPTSMGAVPVPGLGPPLNLLPPPPAPPLPSTPSNWVETGPCPAETGCSCYCHCNKDPAGYEKIKPKKKPEEEG